MGLNRRSFLKRTGLALAFWGAADLGLPLLSRRYQQVLAEPTRRKLALLVGINQYRNAPLSGCLTDVDLQRELLIHRFGFHPQNILTLVDQQATRAAIETAFVSHLTEQAKSGDVVVFHFSGYGGSVAVGNPPELIQTSLVPVDDSLSEGDFPAVNDLLEDTLWLLARSLQTDKLTTVLDTCYTYPGKPLQGNLRIRARSSLIGVQAGESELAFQQTLTRQFGVRPRGLGASRPPFPGVLLAAANPNQLATEVRWNGFSAGLFTYALTRHLWHTTPAATLSVSLGQVKAQVEQLVTPEQSPQLSGQKSQEGALLTYFVPPVSPVGADGVILEVEESGKTARLWLAGLAAGVLEQYGVTSLLTVGVDNKPEIVAPVYLQLLAREGLFAKAKIYHPGVAADGVEVIPGVKAGQFVRERVRVLPRNIGLTVALDSSLERIERVDAISAFTAIPRITSAIAGEQAADYLFSKIQPSQPTQVASAANLTGIVASTGAASGSYGLFSPGQDILPNTAGEGGEAVKVAIRRLVPKLQTLLAMKLLSLTVNDYSSRLSVRATLEKIDSQVQPLLARETVSLQRTTDPAIARTTGKAGSALPTDGLPPVPVGSHIQFRLENHGDHPLYYILLGSDSNGNLITLHTPPPPTGQPEPGAINPPPTTPDHLATSISAGDTLTLPNLSPSFQWTVRSPGGLVETYVICSRAPFTQTLSTIETTLHPAADTAALYILPNPLDVAQAVLQDLHRASDPAAQVAATPPDAFALDVDAWASLRFVYQVV